MENPCPAGRPEDEHRGDRGAGAPLGTLGLHALRSGPSRATLPLPPQGVSGNAWAFLAAQHRGCCHSAQDSPPPRKGVTGPKCQLC